MRCSSSRSVGIALGLPVGAGSPVGRTSGSVVEQDGEHLRARTPVDGGVVDLGELRDPARRSTPSMTYSSHSGRRAVERAGHDAGDHLGQLLGRARRRHRVVADVEVDVEVGVLDPVRQVETERHLHQAAAERRQLVDALEDEGPGGLVAPPPPGAAVGSKRFSDETWPNMVEVSMFRKLTSIPLSCRTGVPRSVACADATTRRRQARPLAHRLAPPRAMHAPWATRRACTSSATAASPTSSPTAAGGGATPDSSWVTATSLLVDTLFDLRLTAEMLEAMAPHTAGAPIGTLVNTHANGDHCYGNELVEGAEIIASSAAAEEMREVPPASCGALTNAEGEVGELFRRFFGEFDFDGITLTLPTRTFDGRLDLEVGGRAVELIEVGPAHTRGDVLVHVARGPHRLHRRHPVHRRHADRVGRAAVQLGRGLRPHPGHGRGDGGARARPGHRQVGRRRGAGLPRLRGGGGHARHDAGMDAWEAARDIALGEFGDWGERGRIAVNVATVYRTIDPAHRTPRLGGTVPPYGAARTRAVTPRSEVGRSVPPGHGLVLALARRRGAVVGALLGLGRAAHRDHPPGCSADGEDQPLHRVRQMGPLVGDVR